MKKKFIAIITVLLVFCTSFTSCSKAELALSKGQKLYNQGRYYESIKPLETAVNLTYEYDPTFILLLSYVRSDRMLKAEILAQDMIDMYGHMFESDFYLALAHRSLGKNEESLKIFEKLNKRKISKDDYSYVLKRELLLFLAELYFEKGDLDTAMEYLNQYEDDGSGTDTWVKGFQKTITNLQNIPNDTEYIRKLFVDNYLYDVNFDAFDENTGDLSDEEAMKLFQSVKGEDDPFSFLIQGELYDTVTEMESGFEYKDLGEDIHYINFELFTQCVNYEFINAIDTIDNPEDSTLIIDVRDNRGGHTMILSSILENLLGEKDMYTTVSVKKSNSTFKSDPFNISFKDIYVLVNGKSASCSEVLAMSLNANLENVTVIGEQTYGKGVTQSVFTDVNKKRIYYIVDSNWEVDGVNIQGVGFTPEVVLENDKIDAYMMDTLNIDDF